MAGSGGGSHFTRNDIESLRAEAAERLQRGRLDADVNSLLQQELAAIHDRDTERINRDLGQIEDLLRDQVDAFDRLLFGGSVAKHTYVDGLSDIDALVILGDESLVSQSPTEVREQFRDLLVRRLPQGNIDRVSAGNMAVTVEYRDGTVIQLLPAIESDGEISISAPDGNSWIDI